MNIIKIIPISNEKYKDGGVMEKYVFDITFKIRSQRIVMTKTQINTFAGGYVVLWRIPKIGIRHNYGEFRRSEERRNSP